MPRGSLNKPCKWSSEPETKTTRRKRLDARRERQRTSCAGYTFETPDARRARRQKEKAFRLAQQKLPVALQVPLPAYRQPFMKVGKTYDRTGKR